tara:strand:+ start:651 stop:782 length:132 start_codon:yes stop_codon:yes gene_type:complete
MRRRDAYREVPKQPEKTVEAGVCPKCGKKVGRGVYFHAKACKG